jgi:hypothetical protein
MNASSASATVAERCDLCGVLVPENHQHLIEPVSRKLECVCDACAILFSGERQKYRRVPRRVQFLPEFRMTDAEWDGLRIPIGVAFLFRNSTSNRIVALYPSPAGPVESQLTLETWEDISRANPELQPMEADVEGLLVYRVGTARQHWIVPIDECFKLIGIIRMKWKGFSGGLAVWQEIGKFLEALRQRNPK